MLKYVAKRILMVIPVLIGVSIIVFCLMRVFSPDPAPIVLGQHATQEAIASWREHNGLNGPIVGQYFTYLKGALHGDLGISYYSNTPVAKEIGARFPATIELALAAILFASTVGIFLGVVAAVKKNSIFDAASTMFALVGVSIPIFWLGIMFIMFFSGFLHLLPSGGRINVLLEPVHVTGFYMVDSLMQGNWPAFEDAFIHIILPSLTLGMYSMAIITRMTRSTMLETLGQDYVRTARAKGLSEAKVIGKHALRNSLIPVITVIGLQFGALLGGALLTESVFSWPGIGKYTVDSILKSDFPVVQGIVLLVAVVFVVVNLGADLMYAFLDPRIKYSSKKDG
ncbi:MAG: peptide ABC transporter permease [Actinobacteria bacterium HGW-Actinobacteria-7]|nr:MAG: peptide ABC transporter permease [Actinobacteria bacterium HGW-Actinobacteria-7]